MTLGFKMVSMHSHIARHISVIKNTYAARSKIVVILVGVGWSSMIGFPNASCLEIVAAGSRVLSTTVHVRLHTIRSLNIVLRAENQGQFHTVKLYYLCQII